MIYWKSWNLMHKAKLLFLSLLFPILSHSQTVTMIIPVNAGGLIHRYAVEFQPVLSEIIGQKIALEFRPGAQGEIAAQTLADNKSDKLMFLFGPPHNFNNVSQLNDMNVVAHLGTIPGAIVARPNKNYTNFKEMVTYSKENRVTYGIPRDAPSVKLLSKITEKYGKNITEIPYKTGTAAMTDVMGGHIDFGISIASVVEPYINENKLIGLAMFSPRRSKLLPNVPTLGELGITVQDEDKYYNNVFLWTNKGYDLKMVEKIRQSINDYFSGKESDPLKDKMDVIITDKSRNPEKMLKYLLSKE